MAPAFGGAMLAPPPADAPDIDRLPVPLRVCADCGSPGVRPLRMGEGGIPGAADVLDLMRCGRCGREGIAAEFDRHDDYRGFLRRIALTHEATRYRA